MTTTSWRGVPKSDCATAKTDNQTDFDPAYVDLGSSTTEPGEATPPCKSCVYRKLRLACSDDAIRRGVAVSEAPRFKRRIISAVIATDAKRFCHQIKTDEVFRDAGREARHQGACILALALRACDVGVHQPPNAFVEIVPVVARGVHLLPKRDTALDR
jgi:hypothetical protein